MQDNTAILEEFKTLMFIPDPDSTSSYKPVPDPTKTPGSGSATLCMLQ